MSISQDDLLLKSTQVILTAFLGFSLFIAAGLILCIPIILSRPATLMASLARSGIRAEDLPRIAIMLALMIALAIVAFFFVRALRRIVATVSKGDPFVPDNADRLREMAWLALAGQVVMIPLFGLIVWFDAFPQQANIHYADNNSFGGLLLALLLFVLARVFRRGTEMRDDLEGTV